MNISTQTKGTHSQLIAASALLAKGYGVSEPMVDEGYDFVVYDKEKGKFLKAQVKTIFHRTDKKSDYYVVFARRGKKRAYTKEEADVLIGVYGNEVYLIENIGNQEYWSKPHEANTKWEQLSPFMEV